MHRNAKFSAQHWYEKLAVGGAMCLRNTANRCRTYPPNKYMLRASHRDQSYHKRTLHVRVRHRRSRSRESADFAILRPRGRVTGTDIPHSNSLSFKLCNATLVAGNALPALQSKTATESDTPHTCSENVRKKRWTVLPRVVRGLPRRLSFRRRCVRLRVLYMSPLVERRAATSRSKHNEIQLKQPKTECAR